MFRQRTDGFTLIELMIGVAIVGILAAIAVPSYLQYLQNSRRADAIVFLSEAAGEQARLFSERTAYAGSMEALGYGDRATFTTPEGHYVVSISQNSPGDYRMTATPRADGPQADDEECGAFTISSTGARTVSGNGRDCW